MAVIPVRRRRFGLSGVDPTPSNQHVPGEEWTMGPNQGCAQGFVEQELANGNWTCIPMSDFQKIQQGNYSPLSNLNVADVYRNPAPTLTLPSGEQVTTTPATSPPPPPPPPVTSPVPSTNVIPAASLALTLAPAPSDVHPAVDLASSNASSGGASMPTAPSSAPINVPAESSFTLSSPVVLAGIAVLVGLVIMSHKKHA